jgi:hypothetical protein
MHLKKTGYGGGRAARGGSMYERVLIPLDGSDIAETISLRREGAWFRPVLQSPMGETQKSRVDSGTD